MEFEIKKGIINPKGLTDFELSVLAIKITSQEELVQKLISISKVLAQYYKLCQFAANNKNKTEEDETASEMALKLSFLLMCAQNEVKLPYFKFDSDIVSDIETPSDSFLTSITRFGIIFAGADYIKEQGGADLLGEDGDSLRSALLLQYTNLVLYALRDTEDSATLAKCMNGMKEAKECSELYNQILYTKNLFE